MVAKSANGHINGGNFFFIRSNTGPKLSSSLRYCSFFICVCCTLNSRTPRIYMLMMVCWLTKLLHEITKYVKWNEHTEKKKKTSVGFNVALCGIMLRFRPTSHAYCQPFWKVGRSKKGATRHTLRIRSSFFHSRAFRSMIKYTKCNHSSYYFFVIQMRIHWINNTYNFQ